MTSLPTIDPRTYLHEQIHLTLDQLRQAWAWLGLLTEPGRSTSPTRDLVDDERAEALAARGMADRAYRAWNLARGLGALAPTPAPVRLGILDAQAAVSGMVAYVVQLVVDATGEQSNHGDVDAVLPWLADVADQVDDVDALARIDRGLQRADRTARQAAGVLVDPVQPIADRCPACRGKSLQLSYDPVDAHRVAEGLQPRHPSLWRVECVSRLCRCAGGGCPCGHPRRDEGRRHVWAYGELGDLWRATAAAPPRRRRIRSTSTGNGWGVIGA